jgi:hypothetical protein
MCTSVFFLPSLKNCYRLLVVGASGWFFREFAEHKYTGKFQQAESQHGCNCWHMKPGIAAMSQVAVSLGADLWLAGVQSYVLP